MGVEEFQRQLAELGAGLDQPSGSPYLAALAVFRSSVAPVAPPKSASPAGDYGDGVSGGIMSAIAAAGTTVSPTGLRGDPGDIIKDLFGGYVTNGLGQYLWGNGVIADPTQQMVVYPTPDAGIDPEDVPGSPQWLIKISEKWTDAQANKWRKRLVGLHFDAVIPGGIAESGGMAQDLVEGLALYHKARYLSGGKVLPMRPGGPEGDAIRERLDPVVIKEQAKAWGQVPFGEDLDERTAQYFADRIVNLAVKLAGKNADWSPEQAMQGAEVRVQKEFLKNPDVKQEIQQLEDDEMSTQLRDDIISVSQIASI